MVSFVCDRCQSTLKKAKVAQHSYGCGSQWYACIDCGDGFDLEAVKSHNSCISEAEKHQGTMFRGQKVGKQTGPAPAVVGANGKRVRHHLDSTDDEEEEEEAKPAPTPKKEEKPAKKAKVEEKPAAAAAAATPAAFDALACVRSTLKAKDGCVSLKKLRKAVIKGSGASKTEAATMLMEALLANADNVKVCWSDKADD